jgi:hypothetical protein
MTSAPWSVDSVLAMWRASEGELVLVFAMYSWSSRGERSKKSVEGKERDKEHGGGEVEGSRPESQVEREEGEARGR